MIRDPELYLNNAMDIWQKQFGALGKYQMVSLLPSYHDNPSSSLLYMIDHFMDKALPGPGYFKDRYDLLYDFLEQEKGAPIVLFGVSYALLNYCTAVST